MHTLGPGPAVAVVSLARVWSRLSVLVVVETLQLLALPTGTFAVATTTASAALFFPCPFCLPLTPCACSPRLYKNQFTPVPHQDNLLVFFFSFFLSFFLSLCMFSCILDLLRCVLLLLLLLLLFLLLIFVVLPFLSVLFPAAFRCSFFLFLNTTFTHDALLHCRQHTNKPLEWKAVDPLVLLMFLFVGLGCTFVRAFPGPHHMHTTIN